MTRLAPFALLILGCELGCLVNQRDYHVPQFTAWALPMNALIGAAILLRPRNPSRDALRFILLVAALLRVGPLIEPVFWSTDINRYVWDGRVQAAGINPYRSVPADPALAALRDADIYPNINRAETAPTIYPPVAQAVFLAATRLGETRFVMKCVMVAFEALGLGLTLLLLRRTGRDPGAIIVWAWNPLALWEIAGSGHVDAVALAFIPAAFLFAASGRRALSGIALAAATLTKVFPAALAPALWRRGDWRFPLGGLLFSLAAYAPYASVGARVLGYLPGYAAEEKLGEGSGFWLVDLARSAGLALPTSLYFALCACILVALAAWQVARPEPERPDLSRAPMLPLATVALLTPHYAWYFLWPLPLLAINPWWPGLWPSLTAILLYWSPDGGRVPLWVGGVIDGGFVACIVLWITVSGVIPMRARRRMERTA